MYKRLDKYPNGQPIPSVLPDSYQPASYGNAPYGESCATCKNFNMATRYCSKWKAPVKPRWWCEAWESSARSMTHQPNLLKKITTSTIEEHYSAIPKPNPKATQLEYLYGYDNDTENENEEDVIMLNVPLMIRLLEYAREDSNHDVDLHVVAENLVDLSEEGDVLEMKDYPEIVKIETGD